MDPRQLAQRAAGFVEWAQEPGGYPASQWVITRAEARAALAAAAEREATLRELLLDVEGTLLAYWTDIPQAEIERLRVAIRAALASQAASQGDTPA